MGALIEIGSDGSWFFQMNFYTLLAFVLVYLRLWLIKGGVSVTVIPTY
jgi:hypothetical protein